MPVPSPLHSRIQPQCYSYLWKDWAGYYAVRSFDTSHDREYFAFRHGTGIIDLTPLFKYRVTGPDATSFLNFMMTRDISKIKLGKVAYSCWCDEGGKLIDDGTVMRHGENDFFFTAAVPSFSWFQRYIDGFNVKFEDITEEYTIIGLQGPTSRDLINATTESSIDDLKFFNFHQNKIAHKNVFISRTGYTGDLGYEIWSKNQDAIAIYDDLLKFAPDYSGQCAGLDALDITRIEAGFVMNGVDYFSANHCPIEERKSSPYELGLDWTVHLNKTHFLGKQALQREKDGGVEWTLMGIEYNWDDYEAVFSEYGLPPELCNQAWRTSIPIYSQYPNQVGYATSGTWSPILKKNIALATLHKSIAKAGHVLNIEVTVEHQRKTVRGTVVKTTFFNPERKTSNVST